MTWLIAIALGVFLYWLISRKKPRIFCHAKGTVDGLTFHCTKVKNHVGDHCVYVPVNESTSRSVSWPKS